MKKILLILFLIIPLSIYSQVNRGDIFFLQEDENLLIETESKLFNKEIVYGFIINDPDIKTDEIIREIIQVDGIEFRSGKYIYSDNMVFRDRLSKGSWMILIRDISNKIISKSEIFTINAIQE